MFRHVVLIRLRPDAPDGQRQAILDGLRSLPAQIPEIRGYEVGADLGLRDGNPDIGIVAQFEDEDAWRTYLAHPAHVAVVQGAIEPAAGERVSIQLTV
jgi:hypothetical protein